MREKTDAELLGAYTSRRDEPFCSSQGEDAFSELMRRHKTLVYNVCLRLLKDPHESEDAAQAVFVVLARKADRLQKGNLSAWLHRAAHLMAAETVRKRMRRVRREAEYVESEKLLSVPNGGADAADPVLLSQVDDALLTLPERYREAVILRYLQNHSQEDAARLAGCPIGTLKQRASRGIAQLRKRLGKAGYAVTASALAALLTSEASAVVPESLLPSILATLKVVTAQGAGTLAVPGVALGAKTGVSTKVMLLAEGAMKTMFWNQVKVAAMAGTAAVILVGGSVVGVPKVYQAIAGDTANPATGAGSGQNGQVADVVITPRGSSLAGAFDELARKGGPRVVTLGTVPRITPVDLRFKPIEGRKFIEQIAATMSLKIAWEHGGKIAVLYPGVPDLEMARLEKDLASGDPAVRRDAAWRARWMHDIRVVPLLVKAAYDSDKDTAKEAAIIIRGFDWYTTKESDVKSLKKALNSPAAWWRLTAAMELGRIDGDFGLALIEIEKLLDDEDSKIRQGTTEALGQIGGEKALVLLEKAMSDSNYRVRSGAVRALGQIGGEKALALLEKAMNDQDDSVRGHAALALGQIGGEKALALLENAMSDSNFHARSRAIQALGQIGGENAVALLEKALGDSDPYARDDVVWALAQIGGEKALALLAKVLGNPNASARRHAALALSQIGGEKNVLALLEKMMGNPDAWMRRTAAGNLGQIGGEKAFVLIEKAMGDPDASVRLEAVRALGQIGGEKAFVLIEKAMGDSDASVRLEVVRVLGQIGGENALTLIEKAMSHPDASLRLEAVRALRQIGGQKALALLEKAMGDPDTSLRLEVVRVLGQIGEENALVLLEKAMGDPDTSVRLEAVTLIEKAMSDPDASVRREATRALRQIGGEKALALLEKAMGDSDAWTRSCAAWNLGQIGGEKALALLEKAMGDSDAGVRLKAVWALGQIGGEKTRALLNKASQNPDKDVREAAADALREIGN